MSSPMKRSGFAQGIHAISATAKEHVGILRILDDGRKFRYAKAGASALSAGKMGVAAAIDAAHMNEAGSAYDIGAKVLTLTVTAGTAITENKLAGGFLQVNDAAGEGHQYKILANTAISASGTSIVITLEDGLRVAMTTSSEFTLVHSLWSGVTESATEENMPVGIAPCAVTAAYYYWSQTGGPAICLFASAAAVGQVMALASPAGSIKKKMTMASASLGETIPSVGIAWGTAGVDTEYKPVFLTID